MKDLIGFYWALLLRRAPAMLAIFLLCTGVGVAMALNKEPRYEATARLLMESPQISDDLASSTVDTEGAEQLEVISQRLMTRENLIDIAIKHDVYPDRLEVSPDTVVNRMRNDTTIRNSGRGGATIIDIRFNAGDPEAAAAVVNEYVTRILDANVRLRTQRAVDTLDFFEQEVDRLSAELAQQSGRILAFKTENTNTLPEGLNFRLNRQSTLEERLAGLRRERESIEDQRERVTRVFEETGRITSRPEQAMTPEQRQLRDLEAELLGARAIYSESNPRVIVLRTRVEQLQKVVAEQGASTEPTADPGASMFEMTVAELDAQAEALDREIAQLESTLDALNDQIDRTPQTAIALEDLQRDYDNIQDQYNAAISRLAQARTGERIELSAKGQRITVVERATPPQSPDSPNRRLIAATGAAAGIGLAATLFAFLEIINNSVRRPNEMVRSLGIAPLVTIPYLSTRAHRRRQWMMRGLVLLLVITGIPAGLYLIDQHVMPVAELASKILGRIGLG